MLRRKVHHSLQSQRSVTIAQPHAALLHPRTSLTLSPKTLKQTLKCAWHHTKFLPFYQVYQTTPSMPHNHSTHSTLPAQTNKKIANICWLAKVINYAFQHAPRNHPESLRSQLISHFIYRTRHPITFKCVPDLLCIEFAKIFVSTQRPRGNVYLAKISQTSEILESQGGVLQFDNERGHSIVHCCLALPCMTVKENWALNAARGIHIRIFACFHFF